MPAEYYTKTSIRFFGLSLLVIHEISNRNEYLLIKGIIITDDKYTWIKSVYCQYNIACRQRKRVRIFFKRFVSSPQKTDLAFKIRWSKNKRKFFTLKTRHVQRSVRQAMFFCTKRRRITKYVSVYAYDKHWPK